MTDQKQIDAMADILKKLQGTTDILTEDIAEEAKKRPDLGFAVEAQRTTSGVSVSRYDIVTEKKTISEGLKKTFYHIIDNETMETVYRDLGLFETAMGIVKHTLYSQDEKRVKRLLELDTSYVGIMTETYGYKQRLKRLDESTTQYDVASAKYSNNKSKLSTVKMHILKTI